MHTCGNCGRTFGDELDLSLHRDRCVTDTLVCRACGERFDEARATRDGWHYACPNPDCDAEGLGEALKRIDGTALVTTR